MPKIEIIPVESQKDMVRVNEKKKQKEKIPLIPRNKITGWPLLQIGFLTTTGENQYGPALGGGKCHDLAFGHYFLCLLLSKTNIGNVHTNIKENLPDQISQGEFKFAIDAPGISITSTSGLYGGSVNKTTMGSSDRALDDALEKVREILKGKGIEIMEWGNYNPALSASYSKEEILKRIENNSPDILFQDGIFYVDLGEFLKGKSIDEDTIETFEGLFQVEAFKVNFKEENDLTSQLQNYITKRTSERQTSRWEYKKEYNSILASIFSKGRDASSKISAATKCLELIQGEDVVFTKKEQDALKNGRLEAMAIALKII